MDIEALLITIIVLIVGWIIISIPLWLAAKALTAGKATLGAAMLGTLLGVLVFTLIYFLTYVVSSTFVDQATAGAFSLLFGFLAFLALYKGLFNVGWIGALAIAILAVIFTLILAVVIGAILVAVGFSMV